VTKYERILRGGVPGSEARGMVIGSYLSLALAVLALVIRIVLTALGFDLDRTPEAHLSTLGWSAGALQLLLCWPLRELWWALPAFVIATRHGHTAIRNGLAVALALTVIAGRLTPRLPEPYWDWIAQFTGPIIATVISLAVRARDQARARNRPTG
jgi:uncharacterized membrane protein YhaH (DUF805 family)